jgi:hypothetical protein
MTLYPSSQDVERNISRHPACQGDPSEAFSWEHDIYALGVLLLEIGLWKSAGQIFAEQNEGVPATKSTSPVKIQIRLRDAAKFLAANELGENYVRTVQQCMSMEMAQMTKDQAKLYRNTSWLLNDLRRFCT